MRPASRREERLRVAREPHLLELAVVVDRVDLRQAVPAPPAPPTVRTPHGVGAVLRPGSRRAMPSSTLRPRKIMKMRSHIRSAVAMSWVQKTTVVPRRRSSSTASLSTSRVDRIEAGERLVENEQRRASTTTAAMNWTFCAMPFESVSMLSVRAVRGSSRRASQSSSRPIHRPRRPPLEPAVVAAAAGAPSSSCRGRAPRAGSRRGRARPACRASRAPRSRRDRAAGCS